MIKQFGRLFSAYPVQSVHAPLNLLIRFRLAVRGHHDWPDKRVIRPDGSEGRRCRIPALQEQIDVSDSASSVLIGACSPCLRT